LIDRINVGFAALTMNKDLGLSSTAFGLATALYSAGYILAEIPSNVMMAKFGARIWLSRIMITWGLAAAATALAVGPNSFYLTRVLLGLAEAGFLPGVFLYLSYWIPAHDRARATSIFLLAQPAGLVIAGAISGPMLAMNGIGGLAGWQWLFILQGLPALILGVVAFLFLTDRPSKAHWLSQSDKSELEAILTDREPSHPTSRHPTSHWRRATQLVKDPSVVLLGIAYFGLASSLTSYGSWAPLIVRAVLPKTDLSLLGVLLSLPPLVCVVAMLFWGRSSDRANERRWHTVLPAVLAAMGWVLIAFSDEPVLRLVGLTATITGCFAAQGIFWTIAGLLFPPEARPVGIAMVSTFGLIGGALSPLLVGWLTDVTGDFRTGLICLAALLLLTALCVLAVGRSEAQRKAVAMVKSARTRPV
jgi:ACS family 4-hydroxyphenylacetate permease-like MFS transporter